MSANLVTPEWGYIGKMPAKGDFVKDGISPEFANRWHDWQQAVIAVSKEQLGDTWNDYFFNCTSLALCTGCELHGRCYVYR